MSEPEGLPASHKGGVLICGVGAPRGLGAAIARRFAAGGYAVLIAGRNRDKLAETLADFEPAARRPQPPSATSRARKTSSASWPKRKRSPR